MAEITFGFKLIFGIGLLTVMSAIIATVFILFKANRELRAEQAYSSAILTASAAYIIVVDNTGKLVEFNAACEKLTGTPAENIIGASLENLPHIPAEFKEKIQTIHNDHHNNGSHPHFITHWQAPDGKKRIIEWQVSYITDINEQVSLSIGSGLEITERMAVEAKLRSYQEQLRGLAMELSMAEEKERKQIAEELHDRIGQTLAMCNVQLAMLKGKVDGTELSESLEDFHQTIRQIIKDTRSLIFELSPPILYELGFIAAVEWLVERIDKQHDINIMVDAENDIPPLDDNLSIFLFKTMRELLVNITKHANATNALIKIRQNGKIIEISVKDNGIGFDKAKAHRTFTENGGFGLFNINDRLDYFGGKITIESQIGQGTEIQLQTPVTLSSTS